MEAFAGAWIFFALLFLVLLVCWIVLPIAVIGTKPLLRQLIAQQRTTLETQQRLLAQIEHTNQLLAGQNGLLDQRLPAFRRTPSA